MMPFRGYPSRVTNVVVSHERQWRIGRWTGRERLLSAALPGQALRSGGKRQNVGNDHYELRSSVRSTIARTHRRQGAHGL
jgi:hypothetical protein